MDPIDLLVQHVSHRTMATILVVIITLNSVIYFYRMIENRLHEFVLKAAYEGDDILLKKFVAPTINFIAHLLDFISGMAIRKIGEPREPPDLTEEETDPQIPTR